MQADSTAFAATVVIKMIGNESFRENSEEHNADQKNNEKSLAGEPKHTHKYTGIKKFIQAADRNQTLLPVKRWKGPAHRNAKRPDSPALFLTRRRF